MHGEVSRWPLRAHRHPERSDVGRGHALICTGATARPGRDRNSGRRGRPWRWVLPCDYAARVPAVVVHVSGRYNSITECRTFQSYAGYGGRRSYKLQ